MPPMSHPQRTAGAEGVVSSNMPVVVKTPVPTMLATTIIVAENAPMTRFGCLTTLASRADSAHSDAVSILGNASTLFISTPNSA